MAVTLSAWRHGHRYAALGYAGIAGIPLQNGLYAAAAGAIIGGAAFKRSMANPAAARRAPSLFAATLANSTSFSSARA